MGELFICLSRRVGGIAGKLILRYLCRSGETVRDVSYITHQETIILAGVLLQRSGGGCCNKYCKYFRFDFLRLYFYICPLIGDTSSLRTAEVPSLPGIMELPGHPAGALPIYFRISGRDISPLLRVLNEYRLKFLYGTLIAVPRKSPFPEQPPDALDICLSSCCGYSQLRELLKTFRAELRAVLQLSRK